MLKDELKRVLKLLLNYHGQRPLLVREYFFRLARRFTPVLATECGDLRFFVATDDDVIGRGTFMYRGFDEEAMQKMIAVLAEETGVAEPLRGRTILDVGGNIGTTTVYAMRRFGAQRVQAFEPAPANVDLLRLNALANGVLDDVELFQMALSDADGEVVLEISDENSGDHRVRTADRGTATPGAMNEDARQTIRVPARRLDGLVAAGDVDLEQVAMVWIDVQGHEGQVLAGATTLAGAGVPVSVEYWPYGLARAGGLELFHRLVAEHFTTVVDMGHPFGDAEPRRLPATAVATLAPAYQGPLRFADLLLLP